MPVILMICFLITAVLLFNIQIYLNGKQNILHEENVLKLEWMLRNAETKWLERTEMVSEDVDVFNLPDGQVRVQVTYVRDDTYQVALTAIDRKNNKRKHQFYVSNLGGIENEKIQTGEEYKQKDNEEEGLK